jgi:hypothetical protein
MKSMDAIRKEFSSKNCFTVSRAVVTWPTDIGGAIVVGSTFSTSSLVEQQSDVVTMSMISSSVKSFQIVQKAKLYDKNKQPYQ